MPLQQQLQAFWSAPTDRYQGSVAPEFLELAQLFSRLQAMRTQQGGAALCIYLNKEKVLDVYTGWQSSDHVWQKDTMALSYSTGKGVLATLAHALVSAGIIEYDRPIAEYWPEFAAQGKHDITLRHALSHQTGLYDLRSLIGDAKEMLDWPHMLAVMAQAAPQFAAGTQAAYQALSFGWIVGGALEKASQRSLAELMWTYLQQPLRLEDSYFGVPEPHLARVARPILPIEPIATAPKSPDVLTRVFGQYQQWRGYRMQDVQAAMSPRGMRHWSWYADESLRVPIPAANGVFSAENLARIYAMLAQHGTWRGEQIIRPEVLGLASKIQYRQRDRVMPFAMHWRLGYHRICSLGKSVKEAYGHMGYNGSMAWCDPKRQLSLGYVHNFPTGSMQGDYRMLLLNQTALRCADRMRKNRQR